MASYAKRIFHGEQQILQFYSSGDRKKFVGRYPTTIPITASDAKPFLDTLRFHGGAVSDKNLDIVYFVAVIGRSHNPAEIHIDIDSHNATTRRRNPAERGAPRKGTAQPKRKSQVTGKAPTVRLVRRRQANKKPGYFPNPSAAPTMNAPYWIWQHYSGKDEFIAACNTRITANAIAGVLRKHAPAAVMFVVEKAY